MDNYQIYTKPYAANVYSQLKEELDEFYNKNIYLAGTNDQESARYLDSKNRKFVYNQFKTINMIDLYYNSKFETGPYDTEGQRKLFLNLVKFRSDVAAKQIMFRIKDFEFVPESGESEWPSFFMTKEFHQWAKETYFGELLDQCIDAFPRYGWIVLKKIKNKLEFVNIRTIRCQQDAKSIDKARYFIIEHQGMTFEEMKENPSWNTSKLTLKAGECDNVYERYGYVRETEYNYNIGKKGGDPEKLILCLTIMTMHQNPKDEPNGHILFMEKIDSIGDYFMDARWSTMHGRLMGIGEVESQFENQLAANMAYNLFRRQLLWSSKKVFQSNDDMVARNLVKDVKDGDVLQIAPNGNITQVDMSNRAIADFTNFGKLASDNADQTSFTFEAATGESNPSGTPFRLGVLMSNTVNSHFLLKQNLLALFFKRVMREYLIPEFKKEFSSDRIISMFADEEGFETLKQIALHLNINDAVEKSLLKGQIPDLPTLQQTVQAHLDKQQYLYLKIPDSYYDNADYTIDFTITGDDVDLNKRIETLTNLYTILAQQQDPRADKVLSRILSLTGENFDVVAGKAQPQQGQGSVQIPKQQTSGLQQPPQNVPLGSLPKPTISPNPMPSKMARKH